MEKKLLLFLMYFTIAALLYLIISLSTFVVSNIFTLCVFSVICLLPDLNNGLEKIFALCINVVYLLFLLYFDYKYSYSILFKLMQYPFQYKMSKVKNSDKGIVIRIHYRIASIATVTFLIILPGIFIGLLTYGRIPIFYFIGIILITILLRILFIRITPWYMLFKNNINVFTYTKDEYIRKYNKYAIFLRNFARDNYSEVTIENNPIGSFSEYTFMKTLKKTMPSCAIGMTKELIAPSGADRIYTDDSTWQQDVRDLMGKATEIYILVSSSESCMWEIMQSKDMLEKTTYFFNYPNSYEEIRRLVKDDIPLPALPQNVKPTDNVYVVCRKGEFRIGKYVNSVEGYSNLLKEIH